MTTNKMAKALERIDGLIVQIERELESTSSYCESNYDRMSANNTIKKSIIELEMEIEIVGRGDYNSRISRLSSAINDLFRCESLSSSEADRFREHAGEDLHVIRRVIAETRPTTD